MAVSAGSLEPVLAKLEQHVVWSDADRAAFRSLPFLRSDLKAGGHLVREGDPVRICGALLSGFAYLHRILPGGTRQIVSVRMPGDFLNLSGGLFRAADHNIQMLTPATMAVIPVSDLSALADERPVIQRALWLATLVDSAIFSQWITNVGRRDAHSRIAHLLCEFATRLGAIGLCAVGLSDRMTYDLPMTQEQIADATGLTSVHVNRTLQKLRAEGLITSDKRSVTIHDWTLLSRQAGFDAGYLHQAAAARHDLVATVTAQAPGPMGLHLSPVSRR